ncbi:MAG: hypothetical protein E7625_04830 [Ruminococcaceae bacterium]|nr:hypothetical protein [Oscillospiraceae bacterium]
MKHRDILNAMGDIDFDLVEDAGRVTRKASIRRKVTRWSSLAACVCVVVVALVLVSHYANGGGYVDTDVYVDDVIYGTLSDDGGGNATTIELSFEHVCELTNDVISARYLGGWIENGKCFLEFEVLTCHKGDVDEEKVIIRWKQSIGDIYNVKVSGTYGAEVRVPFMKGKPYLLLLYHEAKSAYDDEYYAPITSSLIIPLNQIHNSKMYGDPLSEHMDNPGAMKSVNKLVRYVKKLAKNAPNISTPYKDYIKSISLEDIIIDTSYVLKVRVGPFPSGIVVTDVYKGDLKPGDEIRLIAFSDMVLKVGSEWIVVVDKGKYYDLPYYYFTSRQGVLDVSREEEIIELLSKKQ